jgi:hypothetical protein
VTATVTIANTTPLGIPSEYVTGIVPRGAPYALYRGIVSLYVPTGTTLTGSDGSELPARVTTESGRTVVTYDVVLPAGGTSTVTLQLSLVPRAAGAYTLVAVPVGRVRPTNLAVDLDLGDGRRVRRDMSPVEKVSVISPANIGANG